MSKIATCRRNFGRHDSNSAITEKKLEAYASAQELDHEWEQDHCEAGALHTCSSTSTMHGAEGGVQSAPG